jgi:membrane protein
MAGSIAFNIVLALGPLLVLGIGIAGFVLARLGDPTERVLAVLTDTLPVVPGVDLDALVAQITDGLLSARGDYAIAGSIFLLWVATRLSASLRVALRQTFDIRVKRHPLLAKSFDVVVVLVGMVLLMANLGITVMLSSAVDYSVFLFGLEGAPLTSAQRLLGIAASFMTIWMLLFLLYRYMPPRPIEIRTVLVAATFAAVSHETLKYGFSWYATEVAHYGSTLGNLATVGVLLFWIYYESLVFILGGEVAQVYTMRKASRVGVVSFGADD